MPETTRRRFLEAAAAAAAAATVLPVGRAQAQLPALPELPVKSPLPVGPGAPFSSYQSEIYIQGMGTGAKPPFTTNLTALEEAAAPKLSEAARRNLLAWAGGARAAQANARALAGWRLVPRMFIDRAERDLSATVLGQKLPAPIILGPVGRQALAHPDGESATARAASALGLTFVVAQQSSTPIEGVALAAPGGPRWFAIDWPDGDGPGAALLRRARAAGCTHLLLAPPRAGDGWAPGAAVRRAWDGPVVLGGIQNPRDAREALRRGFDGLVVSNERGRRGAGLLGTIDALPRIADAVDGKAAVLFGAGARTGVDVYRALALGADAVLLGRPYVHGLALGGEGGVRHVLRTLLAELDITLAVAGVSKYQDLDASALVRAR